VHNSALVLLADFKDERRVQVEASEGGQTLVISGFAALGDLKIID
jgi:hypothetical protein